MIIYRARDHTPVAIFVHNPKTGGQSIKRILKNELSLITENSQHLNALMIRKKFPSIWSKIFSFAVVRNPWERTVSWFTYHQQRKESYCEIYRSFCFRDWVLNGCPVHTDLNQEFWGEYNSLGGGDILVQTPYTLGVEYVIRFEELEKGFNFIADKLDLKTQQLPIANKSNREHYTAYYDSETAAIIAERCDQDIKAFNYSFDS